MPLQLICPLIPAAQFWFENVQEPPLPLNVQLILTWEVSLQVAVAEQAKETPGCWSGSSKLF